MGSPSLAVLAFAGLRSRPLAEAEEYPPLSIFDIIISEYAATATEMPTPIQAMVAASRPNGTG
jgi:hypothetical protein